MSSTRLAMNCTQSYRVANYSLDRFCVRFNTIRGQRTSYHHGIDWWKG